MMFKDPTMFKAYSNSQIRHALFVVDGHLEWIVTWRKFLAGRLVSKLVANFSNMVIQKLNSVAWIANKQIVQVVQFLLVDGCAIGSNNDNVRRRD